MKSILLLIVVGLVSVVVTEMVAVGLMAAWPPSVDATGNFFLSVAGPAILIVAVVGGLLLTGAIRRVGFATSLLYVAAFAGGQFFALGALNNAMEDRVTYLAITLTATLLMVIWRLRGRKVAAEQQ